MRIFTISTLMPLLFYFPHRFTRPDQKTFKRYNPQNRSVTHESRHATVAWNGADSATRFLPMLKFFTPTTKQHTLAVSSTRVCCWCQLEKKWTSSKLFTAIVKANSSSLCSCSCYWASLFLRTFHLLGCKWAGRLSERIC